MLSYDKLILNRPHGEPPLQRLHALVPLQRLHALLWQNRIILNRLHVLQKLSWQQLVHWHPLKSAYSTKSLECIPLLVIQHANCERANTTPLLILLLTPKYIQKWWFPTFRYNRCFITGRKMLGQQYTCPGSTILDKKSHTCIVPSSKFVCGQYDTFSYIWTINKSIIWNIQRMEKYFLVFVISHQIQKPRSTKVEINKSFNLIFYATQMYTIKTAIA